MGAVLEQLKNQNKQKIELNILILSCVFIQYYFELKTFHK